MAPEPVLVIAMPHYPMKHFPLCAELSILEDAYTLKKPGTDLNVCQRNALINYGTNIVYLVLGGGVSMHGLRTVLVSYFLREKNRLKRVDTA